MTTFKIVIVTILTGISVLFAYNTVNALSAKPMKCLWITTAVQLRSKVTENTWDPAHNVSMCWCYGSAEYWVPTPNRICGK